MVGNPCALAAVKVDGSVVTWGHQDDGGDSSGVAAQLMGGVNERVSMFQKFRLFFKHGFF